MVTLTTDSGKILAKLHAMQPKGDLQLLSGIKIAHLALKHRLGKNHKTRIVVFVGSPIEAEEKELIKIAKKLKKEKVSVDVVSFGEDDCNKELLGKFIETVNGRDGKDSHMLSIPTGPHLSDALVSSAIVQVHAFKVQQCCGQWKINNTLFSYKMPLDARIENCLKVMLHPQISSQFLALIWEASP